jgi:hypothetical protein
MCCGLRATENTGTTVAAIHFLQMYHGSLVEDIGYGPNTFFVPEVYMLAMTYMYAGEREFGLELARRCVRDLIDNGGNGTSPICCAATPEWRCPAGTTIRT